MVCFFSELPTPNSELIAPNSELNQRERIMETSGKLILIVEDEPAHAEAIRRAFKTARPGDEVQVAQSMQQYVTSIAQQPPDIAIMDMKLPDGSALDVLSSPSESGLFPIVVMTSYGNEKVAVEAMKAGAFDYVVKSPEAFTSMPRTAERCLREWRLLMERKQAEMSLRTSEEATRALLNATVDAACILDHEYKFVCLNEQMAKRMGKTIDELMGTCILECFPPEQAAKRRGNFVSHHADWYSEPA